jgi:hypothetical protein
MKGCVQLTALAAACLTLAAGSERQAVQAVDAADQLRCGGGPVRSHRRAGGVAPATQASRRTDWPATLDPKAT